MKPRIKTFLPITLVLSLITLVAFLASLVGLPVEVARAASFTVSKTADTADGVCDADCSLREAIIAANLTAEADTILLGAGTYALTIAGSDDIAYLGDLDITKPLTISGQGPSQTIIDGNAIDRVFELRLNAGTIVLSDLTITGGSTTSFCAGVFATTGVNLQLSNVVVRDNHAVSVGGGVCSGTTTLIQNSVIIENSSGTNGGGIYVGSSQLTLQATDVLSNTAGSDGGGIYVSIETSWVNQTGPGLIAYNQACDGGGIYLYEGDASLDGIDFLYNNTGTCGHGAAAYSDQDTASFTLKNGSMSQNTGNDGGALYIHNGAATLEQVAITDNAAVNIGGGVYNGYGSLSLTNVTISGNSAEVNISKGGGGGGLFLGGSSIYSSQTEMIFTTVANNTAGTGFGGVPGAGGIQLVNGDLDVENSIVANNTNLVGASNCLGANQNISTVISLGHTLESTDTCGLTEATDQTNTNPLLLGLTSEGVHPLQANSPAVDSGVCLPGITIDQRGEPRPQGSACDIGAYEAPETTPVALTSVNINGPHTGSVGQTYTFTASIAPADASLPVTYTWSPVPASGQGTASVTYQWATMGTKEIQVTAQNRANTVVSPTFSITIGEALPADFLIYLPVLVR